MKIKLLVKGPAEVADKAAKERGFEITTSEEFSDRSQTWIVAEGRWKWAAEWLLADAHFETPYPDGSLIWYREAR